MALQTLSMSDSSACSRIQGKGPERCPQINPYHCGPLFCGPCRSILMLGTQRRWTEWRRSARLSGAKASRAGTR